MVRDLVLIRARTTSPAQATVAVAYRTARRASVFGPGEGWRGTGPEAKQREWWRWCRSDDEQGVLT